MRYLILIAITFVGLYVTSNRWLFSTALLVPETIIDQWIPLQVNWVWIYFLTYPYVVLPVFILNTNLSRKNFVISFLTITSLSAFIFFIFPTHFHRELYTLGHGWADQALALLRFLDTPVNCVPSLHISASYLATSALFFRYRHFFIRLGLSIVFLLICMSTMATKQHFFLDVFSGGLMGLLGSWLFYRLQTDQLQKQKKISESIYSPGSQEEKVYEFYRYGVEKFGDFHGGYLNFGYWENNTTNYVQAAENLVSRLAHFLHLDANSNILDVACGMGSQDIYICQNFTLKSIDALDLLSEHLVHAKKRVQDSNLQQKIRLHQGTATALPFDDQSFSQVLCIEGLVHFNTREKFFQECSRVLKPAGRIAFSDYAVKKEPQNNLERFILRLVTKLWNIPYINADSPAQYKQRLEKCGFDQVVIHCVGEHVIPGYCHEQNRAECISELTRIRGFFAGRIGHIIDIVLQWAYHKGLVEYILVEAKKMN